MGTEVLRPQDWLTERSRVSTPSFYNRRKPNYGYRNHEVVRNGKPNNQDVTNPKRFPSSDDFKVVSKHAQNNKNHMAKVAILRRGQSMDFLNEKIKNRSINKGFGLVTDGIQRLGPEIPEIIPTHMYAGSAFYSSPSPSDLPFPTFFKKHQSFDESFDDSATRDLRRLLNIQ